MDVDDDITIQDISRSIANDIMDVDQPEPVPTSSSLQSASLVLANSLNDSPKLPVSYLGAIRDISMSQCKQAQTTSTVTHHMLQFDALRKCKRSRDLLEDAAGSNPSSGGGGGGGVPVRKVDSKRKTVHKFGIPSNSLAITRSQMSTSDAKIFDGVYHGNGAAEVAMECSETRKKKNRNPHKEHPEVTSITANQAAETRRILDPNTIVSESDPLVALTTRPVNFDPSLMVTVPQSTPTASSLSSNSVASSIVQTVFQEYLSGSADSQNVTIMSLPQRVKSRKRRRQTAMSGRRRALTKHINGDDGSDASDGDFSDADGQEDATEEQEDDEQDGNNSDSDNGDKHVQKTARSTRGGKKGSASSSKGKPARSATQMERSKYTLAKMFLDTDVLEDPTTRQFMERVAKEKAAVQLKLEDNPNLTRYISESSGTPAVISKAPPTQDENRSSLRKIADILRHSLFDTIDVGMTDEEYDLQNRTEAKIGVSAQDGKRIAQNLHTDVPVALYTSHMRERFRNGIIRDDLMNLGVFDDDIVARLKSLSVGGYGGFDVDEMQYQFTDIAQAPSSTAKKSGSTQMTRAEAEKMAARSLVDQVERGHIFKAIAQQDYLLRDRKHPCYSRRETASSETLLDSGKLPVIEAISRQHISRFLVMYQPEEVKMLKYKLCVNGANCFCRMVPNSRYGRLYTSSVNRPGFNMTTASVSMNKSTTSLIGGVGTTADAPATHPSTMSANGTAVLNSAGRAVPINKMTANQRLQAARKDGTNGSMALMTRDELIATAHDLYGKEAIKHMSEETMRANVHAAVRAGINAESGFVGIQFLTPMEEEAFKQWQLANSASGKINADTDPRLNIPQLCYVCYVSEITINHFKHIHQTVADGSQNIDSDTRDFLPLNRFEVFSDQIGEYKSDVLINTGIGAGISGSTRLGTGRSLVVGGFPEFRKCNYEISTVSSTDMDGNPLTRLCIRESGMDFRHSLVR